MFVAFLIQKLMVIMKWRLEREREREEREEGKENGEGRVVVLVRS